MKHLLVVISWSFQKSFFLKFYRYFSLLSRIFDPTFCITLIIDAFQPTLISPLQSVLHVASSSSDLYHINPHRLYVYCVFLLLNPSFWGSHEPTITAFPLTAWDPTYTLISVTRVKSKLVWRSRFSHYGIHFPAFDIFSLHCFSHKRPF